MKTIKAILVYCTLSIILSCSNSPQNAIVGLWKEHWISETDITTIDTLVVSNVKGEIIIKPKNIREYYKPEFTNILFDGKELTYQMINIGSINYYKFSLSDDRKWFTGTVKTWRGEIKELKLKKIE